MFDVESVGLHGEAWAFGYVVVDQDGAEMECGKAACWLDNAVGLIDDRIWVRQHCPDAVESTTPGARPPACTGPAELRAAFWSAWTRWGEKGAIMVADCSWPVEARFLAACIDVDPDERRWLGPYPLHDVATARLCANLDPLATVGRLPTEEPAHDPLADARQSARLFLEALHEGVSWHKAYAKGYAEARGGAAGAVVIALTNQRTLQARVKDLERALLLVATEQEKAVGKTRRTVVPHAYPKDGGVAYPHTFVVPEERLCVCACGAEANPDERRPVGYTWTAGDNCPTAMRAWLDGADEAYAKGRAEGAAQQHEADRQALIQVLAVDGGTEWSEALLKVTHQRREDRHPLIAIGEDTVPRHLRFALASAQRAFEEYDLGSLATVNEDIQGLVDAAVAWGHNHRREGDA